MEETEITFDNPFLNLKKSELDFLNVRKLISYFPTSLRVNALTSNELLEFLRSELENKDLTIEELRSQLEALADQGIGGTNLIDTTLSQLIDSIGSQIESLDISGQVSDANIEIALEGFTEIGQSGVFYKIDGIGNPGSEFYLLSEGEGGSLNNIAAFTEGEGVRTPTQIEFVNTNTQNVRVTKREGTWKASFGDNTKNVDPDVFIIEDVESFLGFGVINETGFVLAAAIENETPKKYKFNVKSSFINEIGLELAGLTKNGQLDSSWNTTIIINVVGTNQLSPINGQLTFGAKVERKN